MKLRDVHHLTDEPGKDWSKFVRSQISLQGFKENLADWDGLVDDVVNLVEKWEPADFDDLIKCVKIEARGIFSGEENARKFAAVLMPALMFKASYIAMKMKVPWGLACLRLVEIDPEFEDLKSRTK